MSRRRATQNTAKPLLPPPSADDPVGDEEEDMFDNPNYADQDWTYDQEFKYHAAKDYAGGPGKPRGRKAASDLFALVSSRNHRDIVRKNEFMSPGAFDTWNRKQVELGRETCWAGMQDYDGDGTPTEFVVRRRDSNGPVIAVNGYTTKPSDWASKRLYYAKYPTRDSRSIKNHGEGVSYRSFLNEHYGYEEDDEGFATPAYLKRRKEAMDASPYNLRIKNPSPYNIFQTRLVSPAFREAIKVLSNNDEDRAKTMRNQCNEHYGKGWVMKQASEHWDAWVKDPIVNALHDQGMLAQYVQDFQGKKRNSAKTRNFEYNPKDPLHVNEFEKWLFSRPEIKEALIEYVRPLFNRSNDHFKQALNSLMVSFDDMIAEATGQQSPPSTPYKLSRIPRKRPQ